MGSVAVWVFTLLLGATQLFGSVGHAQPPTTPVAEDKDLQVTRDLVQEIQFMLVRLGLDPGPVDGMPRTRTKRAVQRFTETHSLPPTGLKRGGKVPAEFVTQLRNQAARAMLGQADKVASQPRSFSPALAPQALVGEPLPAGEPLSVKTANDAVPPALPKPPPREAFASCTYNPEDFHIGPNRYTPESFLAAGFDGSATQAVAHLQDRLVESSQIADRLGVSALNEVQRQTRVLRYFQCRLRMEQVSANKS